MKIGGKKGAALFATDAAPSPLPVDGRDAYQAFKGAKFPFDVPAYVPARKANERIEDVLRRANLSLTQELRFFSSLSAALDDPSKPISVGKDMVYGIALSTLSVASETLGGTMVQLCPAAVQDRVTVEQFETVVNRVASNVVAVLQQIVYSLRGIAFEFPSGVSGGGYEVLMELSQRIAALSDILTNPAKT